MATAKTSKQGGSEPKIFGPNGIKLKQIQYRSYMHDIDIYHFQAYHISVHDFRSLLNRQDHGYVDTLLSFDPLINMPVPEGDEVPAGCIEVGYLPSVFQHGGSALGFRVGDNVVEWMCFDQPINYVILDKVDIRDLVSDGKLMLFDHVAIMPKGLDERRVRGANVEHKAWHDSLLKAVHRRVKLGLTWRNYGTELQSQHALQRMEHMEMEHAMSELDVNDDDFADEMPGDYEDDANETGVENYGLFTSLDGESYAREADGGSIDDNEDEYIVQTPRKESARIHKKRRKGAWRDNGESTHNTSEPKESKVSRNYDSSQPQLGSSIPSANGESTHNTSEPKKLKISPNYDSSQYQLGSSMSSANRES